MSSTTTVGTNGSNRKVKLKKSRNGCITCKKRRVKCDESKPFCQNCVKKNFSCGGYATSFKWRSFNEFKDDSIDTALMDRSSNKRKRRAAEEVLQLEDCNNVKHLRFQKGPEEDKLIKYLELASLSVTGKSLEDIRVESELVSKGINPSAFAMVKESHKTENADENTENIAKALNVPSSELAKLTSEEVNKSRSFSHSQSNVGAIEKNPPLSRSMSVGDNPSDLTLIRQKYNQMKMENLHSLADAAVDEIRAHTPDNIRKADSYEKVSYIDEERFGSLEPVGNSPVSSIPKRKYHKTKTPISLVSLSQSPRVEADPATILNGHSLSKHTPVNEELINDINLTPSLSALINYAITSGEDTYKIMQSDVFSNEMGRILFPTSPLTLNGSESRNAPSPPSQGFTSTRFTSTDIESESQSPNDSRRNTLFPFGNSGIEGNPMMKNPAFDNTASLSRILNDDINKNLMKTSDNEQILFLYSKYTCPILSIKNGPNENPWRDAIIPLASEFPCLFNSIAALTLFHLSGNSRISSSCQSIRSRAYGYTRKCIIELASELTQMNERHSKNINKKLPADVALVTCLNLAVGESWDTQVKSVIAHLKGAKSMIHEVLNVLKSYQLKQEDGSGNTIDRDVQERDDKMKSLVLVENDDVRLNQGLSKIEKKNREGNNSIIIPKNLQFVFNSWIYFEVLSQMTADTKHDDKGIDLVATITNIIQSQKKRGKEKTGVSDSSDSIRNDLSDRDSECSIHSEHNSSLKRNSSSNLNFFDSFEEFEFDEELIDPLLGCAQSLFSIMGKVANLISKIRKQHSGQSKDRSRNSLSTITLATSLKQQLLDWKPNISQAVAKNCGTNLYDTNGNGSSWDICACITTSESYRYAALLYLFQAVPEIPSPPSHELAEKIFILLASIPSNSDTYIIHIFPLLVASCEAETEEEKEWCENRWKILMEKMWIGNIDRAFEIVKEVWKRKEEFQKSKSLKDSTRNKKRAKSEACDLSNISVQFTGLMAAINKEHIDDEDATIGINNRLHWSSVMKEWGWEVLLA